jgi:hypothetical protein
MINMFCIAGSCDFNEIIEIEYIMTIASKLVIFFLLQL